MAKGKTARVLCHEDALESEEFYTLLRSQNSAYIYKVWVRILVGRTGSTDRGLPPTTLAQAGNASGLCLEIFRLHFQLEHGLDRGFRGF
jgi:hypothetical protein